MLTLSYLRKILRSWRERFEGHRQQQKGRRALMMLDDTSLADLGITRAEIPYVVLGRRERDAARGQTQLKKHPFAERMDNPVALRKADRQ